MIIDVHAHALDEAFLSDLCRRPQYGLEAESDGEGGYILQRVGEPAASLDKLLYDMPRRLESLKSRSIDLQLVGPPPGFLAWPGGAPDVETARALNRHTARIVEQGEGKVGGMIVVPFGEPERAAEEVKRAVETHGFRGVMIPSSAGGRPLDDEVFEPVFAVFEQLGLLVFMHPTRALWEARTTPYRLHTLVTLPYETTLAVTRFIFSGLLERHPGFRLVLSHGGGNLAFLRGRLDTIYHATGWEAEPACREHISQPPSKFYEQLYFDTTVCSADSLRFLIELVGSDRVMFGTDYSFEVGDPEGKHALPTIRKLPESDQRKIMGENAKAVLDSVVVGAAR